MLFALLLFALDLGGSYGYERLHYGESYKIILPRRSHIITYMNRPDDQKILWTSVNSSVIKDPRHSFDGSYYAMNQLTQKDSGQYDVWDRYEVKLSSVDIIVEAKEEDYQLKLGDDVDFRVDLQSKNCNIFFTSQHSQERVEIVHRGRPNYHQTCRLTRFSGPCHLLIEDVDQSCNGVYALTDNDGEIGLQVTLDVTEPSEPIISTLRWVGLALSVSSALCYSLRCCCSGKSSSKDGSDSEDPVEPTVVQGDVQYESEPVRLGPTQTEESPYSAAPPTVAPSVPLIHDAPVFDLPSYEEALTMPKPEGSGHLLSSASETRFDFTGTKFSASPPLSSEVTGGDVYTSDKLNFL